MMTAIITITHKPHWGFWEVLKTVAPDRTISVGIFDSEAKAQAYAKQLKG